MRSGTIKLLATLVALAISTQRASADEKRPVPDYDGRGNPDAKPSKALWIPRVVLAPVYAVNEFVVRRPFGLLVSTAERDRWPSKIQDLLSFGPGNNWLFIPSAFYDFGALPSVGLTFQARRVLLHDNSLTLHAATWGPKWIALAASDHYEWADADETTAIAFTRRQDNVFTGIGPDTSKATLSRYGLERVDASELVSHDVGSKHVVVALQPGFRHEVQKVGTCCGDPSLETLVMDAALAAPPGFEISSTTLYARGQVRIDSRDARPAPGTGAYFEAHAEPHHDIDNGQTWTLYGGEAGVALDLNGRQRVLKLMSAVELVHSFSGGEVPFYEQARLGGDNTMSGFLPGWMTGPSTWTAGVAYTWPVWVWLDGQARVSVGNAFGNNLDGFELRKLRLSADVGVTSIGREHGLEVLFGVGTETFEQGTNITSVRVAIGTRQGL